MGAANMAKKVKRKLEESKGFGGILSWTEYLYN